MSDILKKLDQVLEERKFSDDKASYVTSLYEQGNEKINKKVIEEALEIAMESKNIELHFSLNNFLKDKDLLNDLFSKHEDNKQALNNEVADLIFHLGVLLHYHDSNFDQVLAILEKRFGTSGIEEKNSRGK